MSSLWTPGGEVPVDRNATPSLDETPAADPTLDDAIAAALPEGFDLNSLSPEQRAEAEAMVAQMAAVRQQLSETPAETVVANHAMGLYELAAIHLGEQPANFTEATLAIDALAALLDGLQGRLGEAEASLKQGLDQLRMAYVQLKSNQS